MRLLHVVSFILLAIWLGLTSPNTSAQDLKAKQDHQLRKIQRAETAPTVDGKGNDSVWGSVPSYPLDQLWLGKPFTPQDFSGSFKLTWTPQGLYILAMITDDVLMDKHKNPLERYWDDDCLEVFVDEDNSGGNHQYNHNAFAYHIALEGTIADMDTDQQPKLFNEGIERAMTTTGNQSIWEVFIPLYTADFDLESSNTSRLLNAGDRIGFALAYCDNDYSEERENFIGSVPVEGEDKNRGWIDAGIFGTLELVDQ